MIKPIKVDLPYPDLEDICPSKRNAVIISSAYSGLKGELTAILQYTYHAIWFSQIDKKTEQVLTSISMAEMFHFELLGQTLKKLGADPVFTVCPPIYSDFYSPSSVSYSKTPAKMLLDDITGELNAISEYKSMLNNLTDEKVGAIVSRLILDEELHVKALKEELNKYVKG